MFQVRNTAFQSTKFLKHFCPSFFSQDAMDEFTRLKNLKKVRLWQANSPKSFSDMRLMVVLSLLLCSRPTTRLKRRGANTCGPSCRTSRGRSATMTDDLDLFPGKILLLLLNANILTAKVCWLLCRCTHYMLFVSPLDSDCCDIQNPGDVWLSSSLLLQFLDV